MFSICLFFVLVLICGLLVALWKKVDDELFVVFSIMFIIATVVVILSPTLGRYSYQIGNFSEVRGLKMKIALLEERREKLTSIIRGELQKYPEFEKEVINNIGTPSFLFNYPQLQSNKTISKTVDDIVKIEDNVYEIRGLLIESLQKIYLREISPWTIYVKSYEEFFGEKNPILSENLTH